jgi:mono/diheme cytochrome c family protein
MPNLPFTATEVSALVAFFEYTAKLDTHGWPPAIKVTPAGRARALAAIEGTAAQGSAVTASEPPADPVARGKAKAAEMGCTACHSTDGTRLVGPSWKALYGSQVALANGTTVQADDAFLTESILDANATVVSGYSASLMPSFRGRLTEAEVKDLVAYMKSLK